MRVLGKIAFLLVLIVLNQVKTESISSHASIQGIDTSFEINPLSYVTYNFTNTEKEYYELNQTASAKIQTFLVNESAYAKFKAKEKFSPVNSEWVYYFFNDQPDATPWADISLPVRINHIGKIVVLLNNINTYRVTGQIKVIKFGSDTTKESTTETTTTNETTDFFVFPSLFIVVLVCLKRRKEK